MISNDSLTNFVSGLGTDKDKGTAARFTLRIIDQGQLEAAYRSDWIARKVIDIPAFDATRAWRAWQAEDQQIELIEAEERRLGLQQKLAIAITRARLYGGAAIIIGDGAQDPSTELLPQSVKRGGLRYINVVSRHDLTTGQINRDIASPYYGEPESYQYVTGAGASVTIHPSRVVRIIGADMPDPMRSGDAWGDSSLLPVYDAILQATATNANLAQLVWEAKVDVVKVPDLMLNLTSPEYSGLMTERFTLANVMKSINNTLMLDAQEDWQTRQINFAGLPDVIRAYLMIATAAADIPATRFLGQSPQGFSATGESDMRNYYDRISADQQMRLTPALNRLDELLIRSAVGDRPPEVHYEWRSLWQMTDKERAEVAKLKADTFAIDVNSGLIDDVALRKARENQLVEDGVYPGLEEALADAEMAEPDMGVSADQPTPPPAPIIDAAPRSLYVRRDVINRDEIIAWAKAQGIADVVDDLHVTVTYSRTPVDWMKMGDNWSDNGHGGLTIPAGGARIMEKFDGGAIVLSFASSSLSWRHEDMIRNGASWDRMEYQPHVTITYKDTDVSAIEPYRGNIVLGPEIFEEVK